jgi:hypothetical protein
LFSPAGIQLAGARNNNKKVKIQKKTGLFAPLKSDQHSTVAGLRLTLPSAAGRVEGFNSPFS